MIEATVILLIVLASGVAPAEAGPLHPAAKLAIITASRLVDPIIVTAVTTFLLRSYGLRLARVASAFLLTGILCTALLFPLILPAFDGILVAGMACVILLESVALFALVNLEWFRRDREHAAPLPKTIFLAAFCGNAAAFCASVLFLAPLEIRLLRLLVHRS